MSKFRFAPIAPTTNPPVAQQIAELAYRFYEERGHANGHDLDDWLRAERTLKEQSQRRSDGRPLPKRA